MAPLYHRLISESYQIELLVTGQHGTMLNQSLSIFDLIPTYNLKVISNDQSLVDLTSKILKGVSKILSQQLPDLVLVHGDTTTTLAASLACYYQHISVAHVEAGLRTYDKFAPYPEEMNRRITDQIADLHFAPTAFNRSTLINEKIPEDNIIVTGNTAIDALFWMKNKLSKTGSHDLDIGFNLYRTKYILVTAHRRENHSGGINNICTALKQIALNHPDIPIVYPVHLNPNVSGVVKNELSNISNIFLIEPQDYHFFVILMINSWIILTDSGGIQEEAAALNKPVLVLRYKTERQEALQAGTVRLVGTAVETIVEACENLINNQAEYDRMAHAENPYGDGRACDRIISGLNRYFSNLHCNDQT